MDQSLIKVENEKLVEAFFLELKIDFRAGADRRELLDLLDDIDGLDYLHGDVLVDAQLQTLIGKIFILFEDVTRVQRRCVCRRYLRMRHFFCLRVSSCCLLIAKLYLASLLG